MPSGGYGGIAYVNTDNDNNNRLATIAQYNDRHGNVTHGKQKGVKYIIKVL
jgi:hypothetical protein